MCGLNFPLLVSLSVDGTRMSRRGGETEVQSGQAAPWRSHASSPSGVLCTAPLAVMLPPGMGALAGPAIVTVLSVWWNMILRSWPPEPEEDWQPQEEREHLTQHSPLIHPASPQGTGRAARRPSCLREWAGAKLSAAHQKSKTDDFVFSGKRLIKGEENKDRGIKVRQNG